MKISFLMDKNIDKLKLYLQISHYSDIYKMVPLRIKRITYHDTEEYGPWCDAVSYTRREE